MNKESLRNLPRSSKIEFLNKISSGEFKLKEPYKSRPLLQFQLQGGSKYKCLQDGRILSIEEIKELRYGYSFNRTLAQYSVNGLLPGEIILTPHTEEEYLDSPLLISRDLEKISDSELDQRIEHLEKLLL